MVAFLGPSDPALLVLAGLILLLPAWTFLAPRVRRRPEKARGVEGGRGARTLGGIVLGGMAALLASLVVAWYGGRAIPSILSGLADQVRTIPLHPGLWPSLPSVWFAGYGLVWVYPLILGGIAGAISVRGRWRPSGVAAWLGIALLSAGFVLYGVQVLLTAHLPGALLFASLVLFAEVGGLGLLLCYQFYAIEFLTGENLYHPDMQELKEGDPAPFVGVQVPCYNEPVPLVEGCLTSVLRLEHPRDRLHVQLLDDSTDPSVCEELRRFCVANGVEYLHREERHGYKAGALNEGLRSLPHEVEFVAVVDADYEVDPPFLRRTLGGFRDRRVAFIQTPQSYRNAGAGPLSHLYALADAYFYRVIQPVRGRRGSAIFCGTMGVLRRSALEKVGGWNEACITEDAELSLRLYGAGWTSIYLAEILGRGLAPLTLEDLKAQHARWAFGGLQMLRQNSAALHSRMLSSRQRTDFLLGGAFWVDGVFLLGMAASLGLIVAGGWAGIALPSISFASLTLIASAPTMLLADSVLKVQLALHSSERTTAGDAIGVLGFWYAVKLNDLRAGVRGLSRKGMRFLRTPKTAAGEASTWGRWARALRTCRLESALAAVFFTLAFATFARETFPLGADPLTLSQALLLGWLLFYATAFASAPLLASAALRSLSAPTSPGIHPLQEGMGRRTSG